MTLDEHIEHETENAGDMTVDDVELIPRVDDLDQDSDDEYDAKHKALPDTMIGYNTPQKRKEVAKCWTTIKRLEPHDKRPPHTAKWEKKGYIHVCIHHVEADEFGGTYCNQPLMLHRLGKGEYRGGHPWVTTHATYHLSLCHPEHVACEEVQQRKATARILKVDQMVGVPSNSCASTVTAALKIGTAPAFRRFTLTKK